jgi:hypothetical protein
MVDMKPRNVATAQIYYRESTDASITHYLYNQAQVRYNEPLVSYNYFSSRGNANVRTIATPNMKSNPTPTGSKVTIISRVLATPNMRGR